MTKRIDKDSLPLNKPRRTPDHPTKSHVVKTKVDGAEKIIRFGEQGASTAGKPKAGESERMTAKRESFKARHASNIAKGPASAAYWANKVKWADGGSVRTNYAEGDSVSATPRKAALGKIADALKSAQEYTSQYEVSPWVPLLGGTGVYEMLSLPGAASLMDDVSYHGAGALLRVGKPSSISHLLSNVDPRVLDVIDVAGTVTPVAGALTKLAKKGVKAAVKKAVADEVVTPKEQKMLQGFYRGYAGQNPDPAELFITPQKRVADFYAEKRSSQIGGTPHAEMILIEQLTGNPYGHSTLGTGANPPMMTMARKIKADDVKGRTQLYATGGAVKVINKLAKVLMGGSDEVALTAAQRAEAGRKAAELIKSQPQVKASEALGQLREKGVKRTTTTQADRTRVGGGNIGGAPFSAISEVDPAYAGKVWGVMDEGTAARLKNLTDPDTAWTTMLGSANQLKTNPIVFDKLKRQFLTSMKQGNLPPELEARINHNLALTFGEGASIRDPGIWKQADTFEKRAALADLMMGQGIAPSKGGVALGGEKSGRGVIFRPTDTLIRETEPYLLHSEHGGDVPTFAAGPRLFRLDKESVNRPDLHPGFPTLITGEDYNVNMIPTPTGVYLPDWHAKFKRDNPERYPPFKTEKQAGPGYYDLALGVKGEGLPSQEITDEYIRHLIREGYAEGGPVGYGVGGLAKLAKKVLDKSSDVGLKIKPPSDNVVTVRQANFQYPKTIGNQTVSIDKISGGVRLSDPNEVKRVKALAKKIASPEGYISRIIVDHNNNVIEGQHRLEALRELGVKDVPVYKIEELADTMPVDKMEAAVQGVGAIHPDHVGQIVSHALEHISEEGIDGARQMNYGRFQKHYNAALDAIQSGASPVIDRDANLANFLEGSATKERLYHGTDKDITEFDATNGVYFTNDKRASNIYAGEGEGANVVPVHLNIKNPYIAKDYGDIGIFTKEKIERLKKEGFDGAVFTQPQADGTEYTEYVAFEPTQVKSAIGNQGTYDVNEPDITKARGGSVNMAEGGLVGDPVMAYDPLQVEEIMNSIDAPRGYAGGGKVDSEENNSTSLKSYGARYAESASDPLTSKGKGYFGLLPTADGKVATEISTTDEKGRHYPLIVPTLTRKELDHLLSGGEPTEMIYHKAMLYAEKRRDEGKDAFADSSELRYPMPEDNNYAEGGAVKKPFTYQDALAFRDSEVGSQIPRVERLLRSSNWNNLNSGLKKQYLQEIEGIVSDPVSYGFDQLKKDAAGYTVYQGLPGGGGTAKAEARDLKSNIDRYTSFLQSSNQPPEMIASTANQGFVQGQKQLQNSVRRMNDEPLLNRISDVGLQVGLGAATAGLSLPGQIAANAALQLGQGTKPMDALKNVARTGGSYFGRGLLSNAMSPGSLVAGNTPSFAPVQAFVPGTSIPVNTALNLGRTAYNVATSMDPAVDLAKAAFKFGARNLGPSNQVQYPIPFAHGGAVHRAEGSPVQGEKVDRANLPITTPDGYEISPSFGDRMGANVSDFLINAGTKAASLIPADETKLSAAHRLFLDTFGVKENRAPVTKEYFNQEEMDALTDLISRKGGKKGSIAYKDYKELMGDRPVKSYPLTSGRLDPYVSISKSLGQFNYEYDPKTGNYKVLDAYDFNPKVLKSGVSSDSNFIGDYVGEDHNLFDKLRLYAGRKLPPGTGRQVDLSVPAKKAVKRAEGGSVTAYDSDRVDAIVNQFM